MAKQPISGWSAYKGQAREMLQARALRRRIMSQMLAVALVMMAVGLWLVDHWLAADLWRFSLWWAACAVITGLAMIFALHDFLAGLREERSKLRAQGERR